MKSGYRYILYIIILLIIIAGGMLYFFRKEAANFLSINAGIKESEFLVKDIATSSRDSLDVSILKSAKFSGLKNNVTKFDFDAICKLPVGKIETLATTTEGELATSTQIITCIVGNNILFPLPPNKNTVE